MQMICKMLDSCEGSTLGYCAIREEGRKEGRKEGKKEGLFLKYLGKVPYLTLPLLPYLTLRYLYL